MWGRASSARASARLSDRRRVRRRTGLIIFVILLLLLLIATAYGLRQSAVRIAQVHIFGADPSLAAYATSTMRGYYLGLIPRDSTFFFPADRIRADILAANLDFAAVSLFRDGLTGLSIKIDNRVPIAYWCGSTSSTTLTTGSSPQAATSTSGCYVFDASGFIYAVAATTTEAIHNFTLYAPLDIAQGGPPAASEVEPPVVSEVEPLRATIARAEKLPAVFDFARQLGTLGSSVTRVVVRGDEVDDYLVSGTRITYVLGREQNAFTALVSAGVGTNLADGSIEYIDLRFDGKVYLKKK